MNKKQKSLEKELVAAEKFVSDTKNYFDKNSLITKEHMELVLKEFKFFYKTKISIYDYVLNMFRQILVLSTTGYLGLLALPEERISLVFSQRIELVQTILSSLIILIQREFPACKGGGESPFQHLPIY